MIRKLIDAFRKTYGGAPDAAAFAPGRVNLIGEHTDYNGGHVLTCALEQGTFCAARARRDGVWRFRSLTVAGEGPVGPDEGRGRWSRYPYGVALALMGAGYAVDGGADLIFLGDLPFGAGLSSSASLEVAAGLAILRAHGLEAPMRELALLCQRAENEHVGVACGIMDQFISAMARRDSALFLDTGSLAYEYAPLPAAGAELLIVNSRVKHSLAGSEYNVRRAQCGEALRILAPLTGCAALCELTPEEFEACAGAIGDPVILRRARHAVYENHRTVRALEALRRGEMRELGRLMNESHVSLRDDYEVSCPELDALTALAWDTPGVLGARMTGGGFGGCMICLAEAGAAAALRERIYRDYPRLAGHQADFYPAVPGAGAHLIEWEA